MSSTTASNLGGMWFGELSAALQGRWQAVAASCHGEQRPRRRQQKLGGERKEMEAVEGAAGTRRKVAAAEEDVGRSGGAMSDATVCLLLDRFAPS